MAVSVSVSYLFRAQIFVSVCGIQSQSGHDLNWKHPPPIPLQIPLQIPYSYYFCLYLPATSKSTSRFLFRTKNTCVHSRKCIYVWLYPCFILTVHCVSAVFEWAVIHSLCLRRVEICSSINFWGHKG